MPHHSLAQRETSSDQMSDYDIDALLAGAAWAVQRGETQTALGYLMTLRALRPADPALDQQIERLRR